MASKRKAEDQTAAEKDRAAPVAKTEFTQCVVCGTWKNIATDRVHVTAICTDCLENRWQIILDLDKIFDE